MAMLISEIATTHRHNQYPRVIQFTLTYIMNQMRKCIAPNHQQSVYNESVGSPFRFAERNHRAGAILKP